MELANSPTLALVSPDGNCSASPFGGQKAELRRQSSGVEGERGPTSLLTSGRTLTSWPAPPESLRERMPQAGPYHCPAACRRGSKQW